MTVDPSWLPPLLLLTEYGGDWAEYLDVVYQQFRADFIADCPLFDGKPCRPMDSRKREGKEETFWHLITREDYSAGRERLVNIRRCERIRWPRPIIHAYPAGNTNSWRERRQKDTRVYITTTDFAYAVVLVERKEHMRLLTAYYAEYGHERRRLKKLYEEAQKIGLASL